MLMFLGKALAVVTLVWFYLAAEKQAQPSLKWAIIGFIGYGLTWFITYKILIIVLPIPLRGSPIGAVLLQVPAFCGIVAAYFIQQKLISDAQNTSPSTTDSE